MSRYRLTDQAEADLDEIWLSIAEHNTPLQTISLIPSMRGLFSWPDNPSWGEFGRSLLQTSEASRLEIT